MRHAAGLIVGLLLSLAPGCGARTSPSPAGSTDPPARADAGPPLRPDAGPPAACRQLAPLGPAVAVLDDPAYRYGARQLIERLGAVELIASRVGDAGLAYVALRLRLEGGVAAPAGAPAVVGPGARAFGAGASDGERLAFCWPDRDLTAPTLFALYGGEEHRLLSEGTVGEGPGDFCQALFPYQGRWWVAWNNREPMAPPTSFAEIDDSGRFVDAAVHAEGFRAAVPVGESVAVARYDSIGGLAVSFWRPRAAVEVPVERERSLTPDSLWITASPFAAGAVELSWYTPTSGLAEIARAHEDGRVEARASLELTEFYRGGPSLEAFGGALAVGYGDPVGEGGRMRLWLRDREGRLGPVTELETPQPAVPVLHAFGDRLVVGWSGEDELEVWVQLFGCAP